MQPWRGRHAFLFREDLFGDDEALPVRTFADRAVAIGTTGLGILAVLSVAAVVVTFWRA
jgi:hypothetical protein